MEPPNDAEPMETDGGATTGFQPHLTIMDNYINLSHEGRFIEYSLSGNIFEVTSKYRPLIKLLGCGASGFINSAMNSETNEKVAIKKIVHACGDNITATRTLREIRLLRLLEHANILGIKDIVLPPKRDAFEDVYIVYELMDTDLEKLLKSNQQLTRDHYLYFMYLFLRGLKYIHSANVLHRNLKPSNLLLNSTNCDLKISDFRLACVASKTQAMTEYASRRWYRAPELLLNSSTYTSAIDVWSVGCIFLEMMTRKPLFPGRDCVHQLRLILEFIGSPTEDDMGSLNESAKQYLRLLPRFDSQSFFEKFPNVPFLAILLVEKMLKFDPRKRISVEDALAHPYFRTWHEINIEPVSTRTFDIDLEEHQLTVEQIKELIHHEYLDFNPEPLPSFQPYPEPTTVENEQ